MNSKAAIYLGRGNGVAKNPGNRIYRGTIKAYEQSYRNAAGTAAKDKIAKDVVKVLKNMGYDFYHHDNKKTNNIRKKERARWTIAPSDIVLKKVKQALRDSRASDTTAPSKVAGAIGGGGRCTHRTIKKKTLLANYYKEGTVGLTMGNETMRAIVWNIDKYYTSCTLHPPSEGEWPSSTTNDNNPELYSRRKASEINKDWSSITAVINPASDDTRHDVSSPSDKNCSHYGDDCVHEESMLKSNIPHDEEPQWTKNQYNDSFLQMTEHIKPEFSVNNDDALMENAPDIAMI